MSLEPQSGAPTGPPVENPTTIISPAERSLMDLWRVLMKRRLTIVAVTLLDVYKRQRQDSRTFAGCHHSQPSFPASPFLERRLQSRGALQGLRGAFGV